MLKRFMTLVFLINTTCLDSTPGDTGYKGITKKELKNHIEFLASDDLEGRGTGTPGHLRAAEYAASLFKDYGLETLPGIPPRSGNPYFQDVPLWGIRGHEASEMVIRHGADR